MNLTLPASALLRRLDVASLGALYRSERPLTVREVHRLGGHGSYEGIRLSLHRLATVGLLGYEERTAGTFYSVNRHHLAYPAVQCLFTLRTRLIELATEVVRAWDPPATHVSFFGSFARQDGDESSDIDVLVVYEDGVYKDEARWASSVSDLEASIRAWTGNRATVVAMSVREVRAMAAGKRASQMWRSLLEDDVVVVGPTLTALAK